MRYRKSVIVLTALLALCMTSCSVSRTVTSSKEVESSSVREVRDTVREEVMVFVRDTLRETTVITVDRNEVGDTLFRSVVTDRDRIRDRAAVRDKEEKVVVRTDTVYIQKVDSVYVEKAVGVSDGSAARRSPFVSALKWIFWILAAVGVLLIIIKLGWRKW